MGEMEGQQYFIDGWKHQTIQTQSCNHHHLKSFVQFIDKAKFQSLRLRNKNKSSLFEQQKNNRQQKSYQSVKPRKNRLKIFSERTKLKSFIDNDQTPIITEDHHLQHLQEKIKSDSRKKIAAANLNIFLTFQEKGYSHQKQYNTIGSRDKEKFDFFPKSNFRSQSTKELPKGKGIIHRSTTRRELNLQGSKTKEFDIRALVANSNEERMRKLKTILFKTISEKKSSKYAKQERKYEIRLKNMLEKSNRKKKKLQELFRAKQWINESKIETAIKANKIYHIDTAESAQSIKPKKKENTDPSQRRKLLSYYEYLVQEKQLCPS